ATALVNAGKSTEARDVIKDALAASPNDVRLSFLMVQAQRDAGDLDGALSTAQSLQAAHPADPRTTYLLGQILLAKSRYGDVVDLVKPAIDRLRGASDGGPQMALLEMTEGAALLQLKRGDEALALLKDAAGRAPDDTAVLFQYGAALDRTGRTDDAEKAF